jgi:hypothetical protein
MKMTIRPIRQEDEQSCTSACLRMVLQFHGVTASREEIDRFVIKETGASFLTEIALFAQSRGLTTTCYAYNLLFTEPRDNQLPVGVLLAKLKRLEETLSDEWYRITLRSMIRCIAGEVRYKIAQPRVVILKHFLDRGVPLIIRVNPTALRRRQGNPLKRHAVVVIGYDANLFFVIDPGTGTPLAVFEEHLLFAILESGTTTAGAYLLAIEPSTGVQRMPSSPQQMRLRDVRDAA